MNTVLTKACEDTGGVRVGSCLGLAQGWAKQDGPVVESQECQGLGSACRLVRGVRRAPQPRGRTGPATRQCIERHRR